MPEKTFPDAAPEEINDVMEQAESCFRTFRKTKGPQRAAFLLCLAEHLQLNTERLLLLADSETSLGRQRLELELNRTIGVIRSFAHLAESGIWREDKVEREDSGRKPLAKPGMNTSNIPVGPVLVVGACNFPFAISVVGTDTISALAVGCPVVVKAHPEHSTTCQALADLVFAASTESNMPKNAFQLIHGAAHSVTRSLVEHSRTACVAFTGSLQGGRALAQIASSRPNPIPFHAEMGSLNPVFVLPRALEQKSQELADGFIAAVNLFAGQMCTKPAILVLIEGPQLDSFIQHICDAVDRLENTSMLNQAVFDAFDRRTQELESTTRLLASNKPKSHEDLKRSYCKVFELKAHDFMNSDSAKSEAFGPASVIVRCKDPEELLACAKSMDGSLTGTIHAGKEDAALAKKLFPIIESKVGRLLWGGFPPGVIPGIATHHGGPWPATTDSRHTSIGLFAYRRFVRPVCRQGFPQQT